MLEEEWGRADGCALAGLKWDGCNWVERVEGRVEERVEDGWMGMDDKMVGQTENQKKKEKKGRNKAKPGNTPKTFVAYWLCFWRVGTGWCLLSLLSERNPIRSISCFHLPSFAHSHTYTHTLLLTLAVTLSLPLLYTTRAGPCLFPPKSAQSLSSFSLPRSSPPQCPLLRLVSLHIHPSRQQPTYTHRNGHTGQ